MLAAIRRWRLARAEAKIAGILAEYNLMVEILNQSGSISGFDVATMRELRRKAAELESTIRHLKGQP